MFDSILALFIADVKGASLSFGNNSVILSAKTSVFIPAMHSVISFSRNRQSAAKRSQKPLCYTDNCVYLSEFTDNLNLYLIIFRSLLY